MLSTTVACALAQCRGMLWTRTRMCVVYALGRMLALTTVVCALEVTSVWIGVVLRGEITRLAPDATVFRTRGWCVMRVVCVVATDHPVWDVTVFLFHWEVHYLMCVACVEAQTRERIASSLVTTPQKGRRLTVLAFAMGRPALMYVAFVRVEQQALILMFT